SDRAVLVRLEPVHTRKAEIRADEPVFDCSPLATFLHSKNGGTPRRKGCRRTPPFRAIARRLSRRGRPRSLEVTQAFQLLDEIVFGLGFFKARKLSFHGVFDKFFERAVTCPVDQFAGT